METDILGLLCSFCDVVLCAVLTSVTVFRIKLGTSMGKILISDATDVKDKHGGKLQTLKITMSGFAPRPNSNTILQFSRENVTHNLSRLPSGFGFQLCNFRFH